MTPVIVRRLIGQPSLEPSRAKCFAGSSFLDLTGSFVLYIIYVLGIIAVVSAAE